MNKREWLRAALAVAGACALGSAVRAEETIKLSIGAVHPVATPWVNFLATQFVPEVSQRAAALGRGIQWSEFYGGQLYKMNAALSSVSEGIVDVGWVLNVAEPSRLPLSQFSAAMPFASGNLRLVLAVIDELNATIPELAAEWDRQGLVLLGTTASDTYHLFTKAPVHQLADLRGRRLSAPGPVGLWLKGSGAVPVDGALTTYYTDILTGVSEGAVTIATGVLPLRIHEVAPHLSLVDIGATYGGAVAMNKSRFHSLPTDVQRILREAGARYGIALGERMAQHYEASLEAIQKAPGVTVTRWSEAERQNWARSLPNLAGDWVRQQRAPEVARRIVRAYMAGLRQRGARPLRDWDKEV